MHKYNKPHPDRQPYDRVSIDTNIRWKESELSGDEHRISAKVVWYYKDQVVMEAMFSDVPTALRLADAYFTLSQLDSKYNPPDTSDTCDQEGCSEKATHWYEIVDEFCDGNKISKSYPRLAYRKFCNKHKCRGDCALEDADNNYKLISREDVSK